jgi:hypothetical protein
MSNLLRIALVSEGKTDRIVLDAAIGSLLENRPYILTLIQPEDAAGTLPFAVSRPGGWTGVYRWCREAVTRSGRVENDITLSAYDILIVHLDADVAERNYNSAHINDAPDDSDLPCTETCPPPYATVSRLRKVLLNWMNETQIPEKVVLCIPSKAIEAWLVAALYPFDSVMVKNEIECHLTIANRLQDKPAEERLISGGSKNVQRYEEAKPRVKAAWGLLSRLCPEASRFSNDFLVKAAHVA